MATSAEAVDVAPYAVWREELAPWLQALREADIQIPLPPLPTVSDIEELWIHVKTPHEDANAVAGWTPFIESLELMELLARVDLSAAWYLLLERTGQQETLTQHKALLFGSTTALPKFVIKVTDDDLLDEYTFHGLIRLVVKSEKLHTATFRPLKSKLETKWSEQHGSTVKNSAVEVAITAALKPITQLAYIHFKPSSLQELRINATDVGGAGGEVTKVADREPRGDTSPPIERGVFTVDSFRYNLGFSMPAVTNLVLYFVNHAAKFINISHFVIARVYREQLHQSTIGDFLLYLLRPWQPRLGEQGMHERRLDVQSLDGAAMRAFCSSIVSSHTLKEFSVADTWPTAPLPHEVGPDVWWPWLLYAHFSHETSHDIHSVALNIDLLDTERHPGCPRDVLSRRDPLAYVLQLPSRVDGLEAVGEEGDEVTIPMSATFSENAPIYIGYNADTIVDESEPKAALTIPEPGVSFRVTCNQPKEDFIEFVLPGVGICWAGRTHLLELAPVAQRKTHPVRHLTLNYIEAHTTQHATDLLEAVGEPIEWLTIVELEGPLGVLLDTAAAFCPNLARLDLARYTTDSLGWFAEPHGSLLRVETLCIDGAYLHDPRVGYVCLRR